MIATTSPAQLRLILPYHGVGRPLGSGVGSRRSRVPEFTAARVAAGFSHRRIASALGITETAVYSWERGDARPSEDHLDGLAKLFRRARTVVERWFGVEFARVGGSHVR